jgi:ferredoxin
MPKIIHYRNKCIGCGICYQRQPEYWRMSKKDGKATLLHATVKKDIHLIDIPNHDIPACKEIAMACPVRVIKVM